MKNPMLKLMLIERLWSLRKNLVRENGNFGPKKPFLSFFCPNFGLHSIPHTPWMAHRSFKSAQCSDIALWLHGSTNGAEDVGHVTEDCQDSSANNVVRFLLLALNAATWKGEDMGFRMNPHLVERASLPRASASPASLFTATWPSARPPAIQRDRTPLQNLNVTQSTIYVQQNLHKATNDGNIYPNPSKPYNIVGNVWFEKYCQH